MKKLNIERNTLFIILEGIAATVILNLYSPFIQMFAKRLGAGDLHIALLNSLPPLVGILVLIPCSILIEKQPNKKLVTCLMILANSLFYVTIAFTPYLSHQIRLMAYVVLIALMNWPTSLYNTTWQSFYSYTFEGPHAGKIFSARSKYGTLFGMATVLATGYLLSAIPRTEEGRIVVYQSFYAVCFIISLLQAYLLSRVRTQIKKTDGPAVSKESSFKLRNFKEVFTNRRFVVYCACAFAFHVSWQIGWPLFFIYNVDHAGMNEFQLGILSVAAGLTSFISFPFWNRLMDKKGNSFAIILGAAGIALNPFFYTSVLPFYALVIINAVVGAAGAGFSLTLFCNLLETLPENRRTVYISVFNTLINISGFLCPLAGVWLSSKTGIFAAFFIIGLMRVLATSLFVIRHVKEVRNKRLAAQETTCVEV